MAEPLACLARVACWPRRELVELHVLELVGLVQPASGGLHLVLVGLAVVLASLDRPAFAEPVHQLVLLPNQVWLRGPVALAFSQQEASVLVRVWAAFAPVLRAFEASVLAPRVLVVQAVLVYCPELVVPVVLPVGSLDVVPVRAEREELRQASVLRPVPSARLLVLAVSFLAWEAAGA